MVITLGLKMKMSRGEMVGFNRCLGYSYDKDTKEISIVPEKAEIVRKYICDLLLGKKVLMVRL